MTIASEQTLRDMIIATLASPLNATQLIERLAPLPGNERKPRTSVIHRELIKLVIGQRVTREYDEASDSWLYHAKVAPP